MNEHTKAMTGGCLCGGVRYEANHEPLVMGFCHCRSCQRITGAGHIAFMAFPADYVHITGNYKEYQSVGGSGKSVHRGFCGECGSRLFFRGDVMPGLKVISASSLDSPDAFKPTMRICTEEAQSWDCMDDDCVKFAQGPGST